MGGTLVGDGAIEITGVAPLEDAKAGELSFVLDETKGLVAETSNASALIVPNEFSLSVKTLIKVNNPRLAMAKVLADFAPVDDLQEGISPQAYVGKNVTMGKRVSVYPFAYIGDDCEVGDDSVIYPNVTLYPRTKIGKRCKIHAGTVIGVDGFGFVQADKHFVKVPQIGRVIVEDDVEIYANNSIARGTMGPTIIGKGTKLDNMNHVAHNVKIGSDCAITVMNAFAGSSSVGDRVQMSGQCAVAPHTHIGDDSIVMGKTGITKNFPARSVLLGYPAQDHMREHKIMALIRKLPELFEKVRTLEKRKE